MGAWGAGAFENDDALDWAADTADLGAIGVTASIEAALWPPVQGLEADPVEEGTAVLAACETIAIALGKPGKGVTEDLRARLAPLLDGLAEVDGLPDLALRGLWYVTRDGSELAELWAEEPATGAEWLAAMDDLRQRLTDLHRTEPTAWTPTGTAPIGVMHGPDDAEEMDDAEDLDDAVRDAGADVTPTALRMVSLLEEVLDRQKALESRMETLERSMK